MIGKTIQENLFDFAKRSKVNIEITENAIITWVDLSDASLAWGDFTFKDAFESIKILKKKLELDSMKKGTVK